MHYYYIENEPAPCLYFRSPIENFYRSNWSITLNDNAPSHFFPLFSSSIELPQLPQENNSSESKRPEQLKKPGLSN